jgi:Bacterial extracellular solute-binding proteins, family 3
VVDEPSCSYGSRYPAADPAPSGEQRRWASGIREGLATILGFVLWLRLRTSEVAHRVYRIGWTVSPPFEIPGTGGGPAGISVELVNEAARRRGISLKGVFWPDSSESALKSKSVDLWPLTMITANRLKSFHISDPYLVHDLFDPWGTPRSPPSAFASERGDDTVMP